VITTKNSVLQMTGSLEDACIHSNTQTVITVCKCLTCERLINWNDNLCSTHTYHHTQNEINIFITKSWQWSQNLRISILLVKHKVLIQINSERSSQVTSCTKTNYDPNCLVNWLRVSHCINWCLCLTFTHCYFTARKAGNFTQTRWYPVVVKVCQQVKRYESKGSTIKQQNVWFCVLCRTFWRVTSSDEGRLHWGFSRWTNFDMNLSKW
jgi:hypothetical protein